VLEANDVIVVKVSEGTVAEVVSRAQVPLLAKDAIPMKASARTVAEAVSRGELAGD
jgi:hypothetical protein